MIDHSHYFHNMHPDHAIVSSGAFSVEDAPCFLNTPLPPINQRQLIERFWEQIGCMPCRIEQYITWYHRGFKFMKVNTSRPRWDRCVIENEDDPASHVVFDLYTTSTRDFFVLDIAHYNWSVADETIIKMMV